MLFLYFQMTFLILLFYLIHRKNSFLFNFRSTNFGKNDQFSFICIYTISWKESRFAKFIDSLEVLLPQTNVKWYFVMDLYTQLNCDEIWMCKKLKWISFHCILSICIKHSYCLSLIWFRRKWYESLFIQSLQIITESLDFIYYN